METIMLHTELTTTVWPSRPFADKDFEVKDRSKFKRRLWAIALEAFNQISGLKSDFYLGNFRELHVEDKKVSAKIDLNRKDGTSWGENLSIEMHVTESGHQYFDCIPALVD